MVAISGPNTRFVANMALSFLIARCYLGRFTLPLLSRRPVFFNTICTHIAHRVYSSIQRKTVIGFCVVLDLKKIAY